MMKREANGIAESSRSKRPRREAPEYSSDSPDAAMGSDDGGSDGEDVGGTMSQSDVQRHGMHIWHTVVNAVNKEYVLLSLPHHIGTFAF